MSEDREECSPAHEWCALLIQPSTAAPCDVCVHPLCWLNVNVCVWRTSGRGWSKLWAVRAVPSCCGSAMSRDSWRRARGGWSSSWTRCPCSAPVPGGHSCVRCIGLICEPLLLAETWKAWIWICDFLCDLPTSYFISVLITWYVKRMCSTLAGLFEEPM